MFMSTCLQNSLIRKARVMSHLASQLPWDALFQCLECNPFYASRKLTFEMERKKVEMLSRIYGDKHSPCVYVEEKADISRIQYFVKCFTEKLREFAVTERAKYPSKEELAKKYRHFKQDDFPAFNCPCKDYDWNIPLTYYILPSEDDPRWGLGKHRGSPFSDYMEYSGIYLQHVMQEEDVEGLLRIATVDPRFHLAFFHEHGNWDHTGSGYGECIVEMYFRLYIFMNFVLCNREKYAVMPDLYKTMTSRGFFNYVRVTPHKIFKLLESNPRLEDEAANKEILRLTFKQLYLFEMLHMEINRPIDWVAIFADFLFRIKTGKCGLRCKKCYNATFVPHTGECPESWQGPYRK